MTDIKKTHHLIAYSAFCVVALYLSFKTFCSYNVQLQFKQLKLQQRIDSLGEKYLACCKRPLINDSAVKLINLDGTFKFKIFFSLEFFLISLIVKGFKNTSRKKKIFFHETSCNPELLEFNCRQACAVESAAFMNPNSNVHLLFVSPLPASKHTLQLLHKLNSYENVVIDQINVEKYFKYTPIHFWFSNELLKSSLRPMIDMADILKLVTLWKFGGIHLDFDYVITK